MQGSIIIPDISGFTNFVKEMDINLGVSITKDLLNDIIDKNPLDLQLSEIEGDALLFYKLGKPIPLKDLMFAYNYLSDQFNKRFQHWKRKYNIRTQLSLKFIVHYGEMVVYNIRGFKKIYGETVIEAHRLLKTGTTSADYILITDDYMKAVESARPLTKKTLQNYSLSSSGLMADKKEINYTFFEQRSTRLMAHAV